MFMLHSCLPIEGICPSERLFRTRTTPRRIGLALLFVLCLGLVLPTRAAGRPSRRATRPNLILVVGDGLRPGDLASRSLVGLTNLSTVLREGFRFTDAYSGSPAPAAARASLLTGIPPEQARIRSAIQEPLVSEEVTLGEMARSVGHSCAYLGIWGLGREGTAGMPTQQGFADFLGMFDLRHGTNARTPFLWRNEVPFKLPPLADASGDLPSAWLLRAATNYLHGHEETAFLMVLSPGLPGGTNQPSVLRASRLARLDAQIGLLTDALRQRQLEGDTLLILTGVPAVGDSPSASRPADASSRSPRARGLDDAGLRVPLVFWRPGVIRPGQTNLPVGLWEVAPTMLDLLQGQRPSRVSGRSLLPWLDVAETEAPTNRVVLQWEQVQEPRAVAARLGRWKGFRAGPTSSIEVFDLEVDPGETKDVAERHPEVVREFTDLFKGWDRPWSAPATHASEDPTATGDQLPTR